jgi:hypothetical protein
MAAARGGPAGRPDVVISRSDMMMFLPCPMGV